MKVTHLLAMTTVALIATGSAFAGPNCKKNCPKDSPSEGSEQGIYEVADREGDGEAKEGKRERGEPGERPEGDRKRPERGDRSPLGGLDLTDDQKTQAKEIMEASREEAKAIMEDAKAKKEAGEEVDRASIREQLMALRKGAMDKVYADVLTAEQQAKVDERRAEMEKRRAEREKNGKDGERPQRERKGKGGDKKDGGDAGLDL